MPRNSKTTQLELFPAPQGSSRFELPPWQALPDEAQRTLTRLLTRLMAEHVEEAADREAADHEA